MHLFGNRLLAFTIVLLLSAGLLWSAASAADPQGETPEAGGAAQAAPRQNGKGLDPTGEGLYPMVTIRTEAGGEIKLELYPDIAPITVENFLSLARQGFYDGTIFHRVIPGFIIQGGDPTGTGMGGPGYTIKGEFASNGVPNDLKHTRGVISMARAQHPDSAGSQFFIMVGDAPHLDGHYAAFGRVISGMEEVDRIVSVPTGPGDRPLEEQRIISITVEEPDEDEQ